jgi:hypothetical protein
MSRLSLFLSLALLVGFAAPVFAELQNVEVGGSVRIRGNFVHNELAPPTPRYGPFRTLGRPIGGPFHPAVVSVYRWDTTGSDYSAVEQRTRLHIKADFTKEVTGFIEFDSYDIWGEDFRSADYVTGVDARQNSVDDVEVFQGYIEMRDIGGSGLQARIGRQELAFGSQWLVGPRDFGFFYTGLSFDAIRLTWANDNFTIDGWASKLSENFGDIFEDDINFYGIYMSCTAVENHTFDAFWMLLDDETPLAQSTNLHTAGLRAAGRFGSFDYDAEAAYQFGSADRFGLIVGEDDADFDTFAARLDLGYAFDVKMHPRIFMNARYYGGEDNRDITFGEWLNPFDRPEASISFNRLFSNQIASGFVDAFNDFSNVWYVRGGVMAAPFDKVRAALFCTYYETVAAFDRPVMPIFTFWTRENDDDLGWDVALFLEYLYSDDLVFEAGWTHLFTGTGMGQGNYSAWNGNVFNGGSDDEDADYCFLGCKLFF